jgi:two-component system phosphate regulon sensor histidine kinase PhoR
MNYLIMAMLVGGLVVALLRLRDHRRAVRELRQTVLARQPDLRGEEVAGKAVGDWDQLRVAINDLVAETVRLQTQGSNQLAQLEATLGSLREAVLIIDPDNYVRLANPALVAIFPRAQNIVGQRVEVVIHSLPFLDYVEAVRTGRAEARREIGVGERPATIWLEITGTLVPPISGRHGPWALFVLHDITRQRQLEEVRKDFVANVSHELRTPLSVIKGYVETLVDGHREMSLEDRERFLLTVQRHTERLNSILQDLLTLSRIESEDPGLRREPVAFTELAGRVIADFRERPAAAGHRTALKVDPAAGTLEIDPLKIMQVFENLLDNAIADRRADPGGRQHGRGERAR